MFKSLIKLVFFPVRLLYKFSSLVISLIGKIFTLVLGLAVIVFGILSAMSVVGLLPGIGLILVGISLVISSIFK